VRAARNLAREGHLRVWAAVFVALLFMVLPKSPGAQSGGGSAPPPPRYYKGAAPIATHRFWTAKNWFPLNLTAQGGPYTMFAEPLALQTTAHGLLVGYSPQLNVTRDFFVHPVQPDFTIGVRGLNAAAVQIASSTDRMVDFDFGPLTTRVGRGMPFVYVEMKDPAAEPAITFVAPPNVFTQTANMIGVTLGPNNYGLFCPSGGRWTMADRVFTCHLPAGRRYLSVALLPNERAFERFARVAFNFPTETHLSWAYDARKSQLSTTFEVVTQTKEGTGGGFIQALYPHQYTSLAGATASPTESYTSARGPMRVLDARSFTTVDTFHGVLPFLPLPAGFDAATERGLLRQVSGEGNLFPAPDTYGQGKALGRVAQLLPLAQAADPSLVGRFTAALRNQLQVWSAPGNRATNRFVYDPAWKTLIGYPASFGSDTQLNDHHFHYGYWIGSAAMLGLYDPSWMQRPENTDLVRDLVDDIATLSPNDKSFPMLRHFDAYGGHSWASGQAPFGDGENQESSSEAVNAWAGVLLYAAEIGDTKLRDAAIWMYTLETNSAIDYWFNDGPVSTFPAGFNRTQISNLFDGKADAATWFGNAPAFEHGIQFLPFTGASLYLGRDQAYVRRNLAEVTRATGGAIDKNSKEWPDLMEMYEAFVDPRDALAAWKDTRYVFDGESRAHEFAWLQSMAALGRVDPSVTADAPFYAVFRSETGQRTHIAFNPGRTPLTVHFSDGFSLSLGARSMASEAGVTRLPQ
jgi:endoglucanase Acf2